MKRQFLFLSLILLLLTPFSNSEARKKRKAYSRKWSMSIVSAYSFFELKKPSAQKPGVWDDSVDGQMQDFFSALELSRNFGYFEVGAKIQQSGPAFISPFLKWNLNKNNSRASIIPAFTMGFVPSRLMGSWLRASLGLSINRYMSLEPFVGVYAWYKIQDTGSLLAAKYENYNLHFHTGLRINLYY